MPAMELQENPKFSMFLSGAWTALYLAVLGTMFGCLIGFGVGIVYTVPNPLESKRLKCVGIGGAKIIVGAVLVLGLDTTLAQHTNVVAFEEIWTGREAGREKVCLYNVSFFVIK